ncbi:MAG: DUF2339 domain-containing protein [Bacteroidia bacterium]|nr:DUF2339 domain-containing protein [Bacteroidia bacterium]
MQQDPNLLDNLSKRLDEIAHRHEAVRLDLQVLRNEFHKLKEALLPPSPEISGSALVVSKGLSIPETPKVMAPTPETPIAPEKQPVPPLGPNFGPGKGPRPAKSAPPRTNRVSEFFKSKGEGNSLEKFIGANIISIVGVIVTLIGVVIGVQYAIENDWISPLTRIVLGYVLGCGLLATALRMKTKYHNFSAVVLSGAMATMYFVTYAAYSFFELIPQPLAFGLMVLFTAFTVAASWKYDRQIIAHIGLVAAYAIPLLLSDGSGKVAILFSYVAIINVGILLISVRKSWTPLYYVSFALTWIMYAAWLFQKYQPTEHLALAIGFAAAFFLIFYATFLAYNLLNRKVFGAEEVVLLLTNSFTFFGVGYYVLNLEPLTENYLGLFALLNALVHFTVSAVIYRMKLADRNLFYLIAGLVLVFITIAVPIQLDGNWVTLIWACEASLMFWIGRSRKVAVYEFLSYPLVLLAFFSLIHDWVSIPDYNVWDEGSIKTIPFLNITFLTSLLLGASYAFINYFNRLEKFEPPLKDGKLFLNVVSPSLMLIVLYVTGAMQIITFWHNARVDAEILQAAQEELTYYAFGELYEHFQGIWVINFTLIFVSAISMFNLIRWKNPVMAKINFVLHGISILSFLSGSLWSLSELRELYLDYPANHSLMMILVRYISLAFLALNLVTAHQHLKRDWTGIKLGNAFGLILAGIFLWVASSEMIQIMDFASVESNYKIGLTLLWGAFAVAMIIFGIQKERKEFRISAMILLAVTLLKLFYFDIHGMSNIARTLVLLSLGGLLLGASFLYNKYKKKIDKPHEK